MGKTILDSSTMRRRSIRGRYFVAFLAFFLLSLPVACGHHHGGGGIPPSPAPNPALAHYTAVEVAHHQPGFFSCANWNGRVVMGTYQDYRNRMHCQLCELVGNQVRVLHIFEGESVYHVRAFKDYLVCPIEQGSLFRYDARGVHLLKHKTYHMGFYDFCWLDGHNYSLEKKNIQPPNVVAIYRDLQPWFYSTGWKAKDMVAFNGKLYLSATGLNNRTEAGIVEIDPATKAEKHYKHFRWCWTGGLAAYQGAVWVTADCDGLVYSTRGEEWHLGDHGWFVGKVWDTLFVTTGGKWRGDGPSHLYVFNTATRQFVKVLDFRDAEPWFMCEGENQDAFYLVTRNEHEDNLGRVYKITRSW